MISFTYAFKGIANLFYTEHNAWIHFIAMILVIGLGIIFKLPPLEWGIVVLAIGFVFVSELFNTTIEKLADIVEPEQNLFIAKIKDLSAGAVLISAIVALIVGALVFIPKILEWFR